MADLTICDRCSAECDDSETQPGQPGTEWEGCTLCNDCYAENEPPASGVKTPDGGKRG